MKKVVVIGGNAAGMSAASQIKRLQPDWSAVVLEKGNYISYAACGIPYYIGGAVSRLEDLVALTPETAVHKRKIDLRLQHAVTGLDPARRELLVQSPAGMTRETYDYLVICTGAKPVEGEITVYEGERIFRIKDLTSASRLQEFLSGNQGGSCAVIGGGYIALEMAEALSMRGVETHLFHRREELTRSFEPEISAIARSKMEAEGITLHCGEAVHSLEADGERVIVRTAEKEYAFSCAVVAVGVAPDTGFLRPSGIALGLKGSIKVSPFLQTNYKEIYAAGDCTETTHLVTGKPAYIPLALKANKEGYIAGINVCGGQETFPGIIGTAVTKLFDLGLARTGLTLAEATANGFSAKKYTVSAHSRAGYYPETGSLESVIVIEQGSGRILGAQLAGPLDSVKRIDVYAAAVQTGMTLAGLYNLDISYAPPFAPVYDPIILAARVGKKHL